VNPSLAREQVERMPGLFVEPHKFAPGLGTAAAYGGDTSWVRPGLRFASALVLGALIA